MKKAAGFVILCILTLLISTNVSQVFAEELSRQDHVFARGEHQSNDQIAEFNSEIDDIQKAIDIAIENSTALYVLIFNIRIDQITISGDFALATINLLDKLSGETIVTEPGYILIHRTDIGWTATMPDDPAWSALIYQAPDSLISLDMKEILGIQSAENLIMEVNAYDGYYLPWPGGVTHQLTRSISHENPLSYYAFDFIDSVDPLFEISAARSGEVWYAVWSWPNGTYTGNCNDANYLVVKNDIGLYDVYLHLAQNSIPLHLRIRGNPVQRGEKVGNADDTGCSSGHHLHFMAHTNPYSWYAQSVDITFLDVNVCGGRPRLPSEDACATTAYNTSGNYRDTTSPISTLSLSGTSGENGWYRSSVTATLSATDNLTGVSYSQYNQNGVGWVTYTGPITINTDASHVLQYRSVDRAGNWEAAKSAAVNIDTAAPLGSVQIMGGWETTYKTSVSMQTLAGDNTSGVVLLQLRDAGGVWSGWLPYSITSPWVLPALSGQSYTVEAQYKDSAGNISSVYSDSINLDIYPDHPASQNFQLRKSTFGMSATNSRSTNFQLDGTLSQVSSTGYSESDNYQVTSGFWGWMVSLVEYFKNFLPVITK